MVALADNLAERPGIKTRRRKYLESEQSRPVAAWKRLSRCRMIRLIGIAPCPIGIAASLPQTRYFESSGIGIAASLPRSVDGRVAFVGDQIPDGRQDARATIPICGSIPHRDFALLGSTGRLRGSAPLVGTQPLVTNLYQGIALDPITGLYYERFRKYSLSLGTVLRQKPNSRHAAGAVLRVISQDQAQYLGDAAHTGSGPSGRRAAATSIFSVAQGSPTSSINSANTYQFVKDGPMGAVDGLGLVTKEFKLGFTGHTAGFQGTSPEGYGTYYVRGGTA